MREISGAQRLQNGFRLLSAALLVYAASAASSGASAGLFVAAYLARNDPVTGVFNIAGGITLLGGLALVTLSLALLVPAFSRLYEGSRTARLRVARVLSLTHLSAFVAYGFLIIAGALLLLGFFTKGGVAIFELGVILSAPAALAFLAAIVAPAVTLANKPGPAISWAAAGLGATAVIGELVLALNVPTPATPPDWLTLGGFPLINWNLPFGISVALSALLVWLAYRFVPERRGPVRRN